MTERCPHCEWIPVPTYSDPDAVTIARPCHRHQPTPCRTDHDPPPGTPWLN